MTDITRSWKSKANEVNPFCFFGMHHSVVILIRSLGESFFFLQKNYIFPVHFTLTKAAYAVKQNVQIKSHEFITDEELNCSDI